MFSLTLLVLVHVLPSHPAPHTSLAYISSLSPLVYTPNPYIAPLFPYARLGTLLPSHHSLSPHPFPRPPCPLLEACTGTYLTL